MAVKVREYSREAEFFRLGQEHVPAVLELERLCFSHPWSREQFDLAFGQRIFHVFGLREPDSGRLLAYLAFYHAVDQMEILNLAVRPELRRQGLGARLLGLVLQIGRKMGIHKAYLEVRRTNRAARALYAGFGFARVGVREGYYPDTGEDALVMCLDLDSGPRSAA